MADVGPSRQRRKEGITVNDITKDILEAFSSGTDYGQYIMEWERDGEEWADLAEYKNREIGTSIME